MPWQQRAALESNEACLHLPELPGSQDHCCVLPSKPGALRGPPQEGLPSVGPLPCFLSPAVEGPICESSPGPQTGQKNKGEGSSAGSQPSRLSSEYYHFKYHFVSLTGHLLELLSLYWLPFGPPKEAKPGFSSPKDKRLLKHLLQNSLCHLLKQ